MIKMNEISIIGDLGYTCYFLTNEDIYFETEDQKNYIEKITRLYFCKLDNKHIRIKRIIIEKNYIQISFNTTPFVNLTKFISNFKSVTSRSIKNSNGVWLRNYLIITEND